MISSNYWLKNVRYRKDVDKTVVDQEEPQMCWNIKINRLREFSRKSRGLDNWKIHRNFFTESAIWTYSSHFLYSYIPTVSFSTKWPLTLSFFGWANWKSGLIGDQGLTSAVEPFDRSDGDQKVTMCNTK